MRAALNRSPGARPGNPAIADYGRVYVHVGLHRTGSTYLQRVVLPLLDVDLLVKPRMDHLLHPGGFDPGAARSRLEALLVDKRSPRLVVSQETLSGRPAVNPPDWPGIVVERLHAMVPEARIILVLRNQWDYLESLYAYRVMSRGLEIRSFSGYLRRHLEGSLLSTLAFDRLVDAYRSRFGEGYVLVLLQERLASDPRGLLEALCSFMQVESPEIIESRWFNATSRSPWVLSAHRLLNVPGRCATGAVRFLGGRGREKDVKKAYSRVKERLTAPLSRAGGRPKERLAVDPEVKARIDRVIGPANRRLEALLGEDLAAYGYRLD